MINMNKFFLTEATGIIATHKRLTEKSIEKLIAQSIRIYQEGINYTPIEPKGFLSNFLGRQSRI